MNAFDDKVWEGRGDALKDARFAQLPGRAADDMRLNLIHFRLLSHIARQNARRGWARISQTELAAEWGCSRTRINGAVRDLVAWLYVQKVDQTETGESFCHYRVDLDADDGIRSPGQQAGDGQGDDHGGGVSRPGDTPPGGGVSRPRDTGVSLDETPVSPLREHHITDIPESPKEDPPIPPAGGDEIALATLKSGGQPLEQALVADLAAHGLSGSAVSHLLAPVLAQKRCSIDLRSYAVLADLAKAAHGIPEPALKAAAGRLLAADGKVTAERLRREIKAAKGAGQMLVIDRSSPGWAAWMAHYRANGEGLFADLMDRNGRWQVPRAFPVAAGDSSLAARADTPSASRPAREMPAAGGLLAERESPAAEQEAREGN